MTSRFKIKRDIVTTNAPHPDQLQIGELALNAVTGKLYTKLVNGKIIEYVGQLICYEQTPSISFSDVAGFCCFGDLLTVTVRDLKPAPTSYIFEIEDLSNNTVNYSISAAIYSDYTTYPDSIVADLAPTPINLRQAIVPITLNIQGQKNLTVLKFKVVSDNNIVAERTLTIACKEC